MSYDATIPNENNLVRTSSGDLVKTKQNFVVLHPVATSGLHGLISGGVPDVGSVPYLSASGTDQDWHYKQLDLDALSGINVSGAVSGDTIRYDGSNWLPFLLHTVKVVSGTDIAGAIAELPNGGIVDARATGDMTISSPLALSGICLLLGPHTYTVSAATAFTMNDTSKVLGAGFNATTLFHASGQAVSGTGIIENADQAGGNSYIVLEGFRIDGNRANQANPAHGVLFINCSYTDVWLRTDETGFYAYHHRNPVQSNYYCRNLVSGCASGQDTQVRIVNASGATSYDFRADENYLDGSTSDAGGIAISASSGTLMVGGSCSRNEVVVGNGAGTNTFGVEVFSQDAGEGVLRDYQVCRNRIRGDAAGMTTKGLSISGRTLSGVVASHNLVRDCPGVSYEVAAGHVSVIHNRAENSGRISVALNQVQGAAKSFAGLDVSWNEVVDCTSSQGGIHVNCGSSHTISGGEFIGNQVLAPSGNGLRFDGGVYKSRIAMNKVADSSAAAGGSHAFVFQAGGSNVLTDSHVYGNEIVDWTTGAGFRDQVSQNCTYGLNYFKNVTTRYSFGGTISGQGTLEFHDRVLTLDAGAEQADAIIKTTSGNATMTFQCGSGTDVAGFIFVRAGDANRWNFRMDENDVVELRHVPNDARPFQAEPGLSLDSLLYLASGAAGTDAVGINTSNPSERLHVVGSGLFVGDLQVTSGGGPITVLSGDGSISAPQLKAGTSQANAGADAGEIWVDTASGNVLKLGV